MRRWLRFVGLEQAPEQADERPHGAGALARRERCEEVRAALKGLAARQAEVLRLVFYHEKDQLLPRNRQYHELLERLKIAHDFTTIPNAGHSPQPVYDGLGDANWAFYRRAFTRNGE